MGFTTRNRTIAVVIGLVIVTAVASSALQSQASIFFRITELFLRPRAISVEGETTLAACSGMNGVRDGCYWRYQSDASSCSREKPCSKLVVFFSGGEMNCDESFQSPGTAYHDMLSRYTKDGYIAVCAGLFTEGESGGKIPYNQEENRVNAIFQDINRSREIQSLWNGRDLLIAGVSHGATAPVIAMAHTRNDNQASWKGKKNTASCFYDGIYDPLAGSKFLSTNRSPLCTALRNRVTCQRYTDTATNCPEPPLSTPDILRDTITNVFANEYAVENWKLIECGSSLPACALQGGDMVPAEPIKQLCDTIDKGRQHTCEFASLPQDGHNTCMGSPQGIEECKGWFNNLVGRR